jgi:hypothetical protein
MNADALTLNMVANLACAVGLDMGFSAAEVVRWCNPETLDLETRVTWGDAKVLKAPRLRTPQEYAVAYADDEPCLRKPVSFRLSEADFLRAAGDLRQCFYGALLEVTSGE